MDSKSKVLYGLIFQLLVYKIGRIKFNHHKIEMPYFANFPSIN